MAPRKDLYATLSIPGTKKISVCARRIGSKERLAVIATCNDEVVAEKIVEALNAHQGMVDKLELPLQKQLDELRDAAKKYSAIVTGLRNDLNDARSTFAEQKRLKDNEIYNLKREVSKLIVERDAARVSSHPALTSS